MDEAKQCCMCNQEFLLGETIRLTDEEMAVLGPFGERELHYCESCLRACRNLQQGASIQAGLFERFLRSSGVANAKRLAEEFKQRLLNAAKRKLQ